jgi:GTPase-associated protein 1, N-terminal domain type 2/GTPase-associated protein 1, middle domain
VTLYQLHYTSCEDGPAGYSGFQFCAASPGVAQTVMRAVERQTIYEPPIALQAEGTRSPDDFPVNLLYTFNHGPDFVILARVQFTGLDFSNRSGNYFAHSLITDSPETDLSAVLPVELWNASFWQSRRGDRAELPPLPEPEPSGFISRTRIADFLADAGGTCEQIATLLTAADAAMDAGRQVLLIGPDTQNVCQWIAAASYLLGPGLARRLSFSTYSYDPRHCATHIVGTISAVGPLRADIARAFHIFDLAQDAAPDVSPGAAALLLARLGVVAAVDLWELASSLSPSPVRSLAEEFPVLASAALILGHQLTTPELATALDWLLADGRGISAGRFAAAARGALTLRLAGLTASEKHQLVTVAARGDGPTAASSGELVGLVERALVRSAFGALDNGTAIGAGIGLRTPAAKDLATDGCSLRLSTSDPRVVVDVLTWAGDAGVEPDGKMVRLAGRDTILPGLLAGTVPPGLAEISGDWPVLRAGVVAGLASLPPARQLEAVVGRSARILRVSDFAADRSLGTEWLIAQLRNGFMTRCATLAEFIGMRVSWPYTPADGEQFIGRLWGDHEWTPDEGTELIDLLDPAGLAENLVRPRLGLLLRTVPPPDRSRAWITFVLRLAALPPGTLPREQAKLVDELSGVLALLRQARNVNPPDAALAELLRRYLSGSEQACGLLHQLLPPFLLRHSNLSSVLGSCPPDLFFSLRDYSANALANDRLDGQEVANLAVSMLRLRNHKMNYGNDLDGQVLRPILKEWRPSQIGLLAAEVDSIARDSGRASHALRLWHQRIRRRIIPAPRLWWSTN